MNRWNVIALYAGIICLISMGCIIFSVVSIAHNTLTLTIPWYLEASMHENSPYFQDIHFQDNQSYINYRCPAIRKDTSCSLAGKSDNEITALRERDSADYHVQEIVKIKTQAMKSVLDGLISFVISLVFFTIHWRVLRRSLLTTPH